MVRREDDLRVSLLQTRWSSLRDKILESMEEKEKRNHDYHHGASSSSLRIMNIDLNELPISGSEMDDEKECEAKRRYYEVPSGASSSTASFWLHNNIDLNELPCMCERGEPHNPERCCSLSLLGDHIISENLQDPNSRKRPLVREGRNSGSLNKAKKRRTKADLEVEDAKLIFKKTLSKSDVNRGQSRLLIPFNKLERNDFLTQVESSFLEKDKKGQKPGVGAILVNQWSETWGLVFKRWVMKKKKKKKKKDSQNGTLNYVLNCGWNDIVKGNKLKPKDKISLWSFRCDGVLCFALFTHPPTIGAS